jgi:hypothetical protein
MTDQTIIQRTSDDAALQYAWKRFLNFDNASIRHKPKNMRLRTAIIMLGFLASTLSVISGFHHGPPDLWKHMLQLSLIIVPLIAAGLITYAFQFTPSLSWIAYRMGAELIRHHIFLYRMMAGEYFNKPSSEQQQMLVAAVEDATRQVREITSAPQPYIEDVPNLSERLMKHFAIQQDKDDGFSKLTVDQYIEWRVKDQKDWYVQHANQDFRYLKQARVLVLIIMGMSSGVAALGGEPLVALTTAAALTMGMLIETAMYGKNYSIYHGTVEKIEHEIARWKACPPEVRRECDFVAAIERIFQEERDLWMHQASQTQLANEQSIMRNLGRTSMNSPELVAPSPSVVRVDNIEHIDEVIVNVEKKKTPEEEEEPELEPAR